MLTEPWIVFLEGDLGAGKTTFVRGLLGGLGYAGIVKSPTYTLIESYMIQEIFVLHLDLYRLNDPQELLSIGLNDYLKEPGIICIEWPKKGVGFLPPPDLEFELTPITPIHGALEGRELTFNFCSARACIFKEVLS
jgi:tRNA threonylcarbamoyladenosine biosynthesis protein TsaE